MSRTNFYLFKTFYTLCSVDTAAGILYHLRSVLNCPFRFNPDKDECSTFQVEESMGSDDLMKIFETRYKEIVEFDRHMGMELSVQSPGHVTYTMELKKQHLTAPDSAHGGVAAAMMDATLGIAAFSYAVTKGNMCATVEFKINYLKQGQPGRTLLATGRVKHAGKRLLVSEGDIVEKETGELVATGLGTFTQYPADRRENIQSVIGEGNAEA